MGSACCRLVRNAGNKRRERSKTCACPFVSCHLGPLAWGPRGSAATSPCFHDGAWVLSGSSSQVNICLWRISRIIKPNQVGSASVPGRPEKLAQRDQNAEKGGEMVVTLVAESPHHSSHLCCGLSGGGPVSRSSGPDPGS